MAGFDHKCPYCNQEIDVRSAWESRDYSTDFQVACDWCKRNVQIDVSSEPIFETSKPTCSMCSRAELGSNPYYCDPCHSKLIALSAQNEIRHPNVRT